MLILVYATSSIIYLLYNRQVRKNIESITKWRGKLSYAIYFDESNKLDQANRDYSYYGALGANGKTITRIIENIKNVNSETNSQNEMHFVDYTSDTNFEKYFKSLCYVINEDVNINLMIVNNNNARNIAEKMEVTLAELRELFYVKIPERLFYGMTRRLHDKELINITIDQNDEYNKIQLPRKLEEQMNAHSAYRNKGYKIKQVQQLPSHKSIPLQIIDTFMGMIVFIIEKQFNTNITQYNNSVSLKVKSDLIYRFLIQANNVKLFQNKITLFKWEGNKEEVIQLRLSDYLTSFIINKTRYDVQQMNKLEKIRIMNPSQPTKYYRQSMGYSNRELKTLQGYIDELDGKGRNGYYFN